MIIRSEQMEEFELAAEDGFVRRLGKHLLENYAKAIVRLPDEEKEVKNLPEDKLHLLVRKSIERARSYGLSFESAISAFSAIMFEVAPNFDRHSMSRLCLKDKNIDPNERLDELLKLLTEEHWEKIRNDYDVNAWEEQFETDEISEEEENPVLAATTIDGGDSQDTEDTDFDATIANFENAEQPRKPVDLDEINFAETMVDFKKPESPDQPTNLDEINFDATEINIQAKRKPEQLKDEKDFDLLETVMNIENTEE